jgi:hypothetical protein
MELRYGVTGEFLVITDCTVRFSIPFMRPSFITSTNVMIYFLQNYTIRTVQCVLFDAAWSNRNTLAGILSWYSARITKEDVG